MRDGKGFVQCKEVDHNCYKNSQISLGIVGEFASKSVVLCSDGKTNLQALFSFGIEKTRD